MKKITLLLVVLVAAFQTAFSQEQHHKEYAEFNKMDAKLELLMDSAAKHMIFFILNQSEEEYNKSLAIISQGDSLYRIMVEMVAKHHGNHQDLEKTELSDRKDEFALYKDPKLKPMILAETAKQRTEKVKFHGKSYLLTSKSKAKLEIFEEFLPRN